MNKLEPLKKTWLLFYALTIAFLTTCKISYGQKIERLELGKKISILNNRAFLSIPTKGLNIPRGSLMSASPNQEKETRIIFDAGKMRFVLLASELYKYADRDFLNQVNGSAVDSASKKKVIANKNGMFAVQVTPTVVDSVKDAILVNSMLVKTKDNTIFRVDAYISPSAFKRRKEFEILSGRIFSTLQIGPRLNRRDARCQNVNIWGTKKNFRLAIPEDYTVTVDRKYDFQVISFHKYTAFGDTTRLSLEIYTGGYPWKDYEHYGFAEESSKNVTGNFVNQRISWMTFEDKTKHIFIKEQKIPLEQEGDDGLLVHIGMVSNESGPINELTNIVEAIKLEN